MTQQHQQHQKWALQRTVFYLLKYTVTYQDPGATNFSYEFGGCGELLFVPSTITEPHKQYDVSAAAVDFYSAIVSHTIQECTSTILIPSRHSRHHMVNDQEDKIFHPPMKNLKIIVIVPVLYK